VTLNRLRELAILVSDIFVDPITLRPLSLSLSGQVLEADGIAVPFENGVVDFYRRTDQSVTKEAQMSEHEPTHARALSDDKTDPAGQDDPIDSAPELRAAHEHAFESAEDSGGNIYGSLDDAATITQSGHEARMRLLDEIKLGDLTDKVVVDFGTGPWSFAAIFDKLRSAGTCIGFDVSATALKYAWNGTSEDRRGRTVYATSDGEVIPLADNSVDIFFGGEVIEHVRNPRLFMQEIARVCKDGASVILTTPNKDAFAYRIHGLQYCVGPEHIALLSHDEFRGILSDFSTDIEILGYETSIGLFEDDLPTQIELLETFQARSRDYPELATGLISISRIDKKLHSNNKRSLRLKEIIHSDPLVLYEQPPQPLSLFSSVTGALIAPGSTVQLPVRGESLFLLFWGHDWSGEVEITCGAEVSLFNLYSKQSGFIRIEIDNDSNSNLLTIRPTGNKDPRSHDNQVLFFKLLDYENLDAERCC
tara:strand:- start:17087 stop:18520 length:1434 start_codon:yes stop_codon:yes gene_type:complete